MNGAAAVAAASCVAVLVIKGIIVADLESKY